MLKPIVALLIASFVLLLSAANAQERPRNDRPGDRQADSDRDRAPRRDRDEEDRRRESDRQAESHRRGDQRQREISDVRSMVEEISKQLRSVDNQGGAFAQTLREALTGAQRKLEDLIGRPDGRGRNTQQGTVERREIRRIVRRDGNEEEHVEIFEGDRRRDEQGDEHAHAMERLEHMHIAWEHLRHAGMHDVANHVMERAEELERHLDRSRDRRPDGGERMIRELMEHVQLLRKEVAELREQIQRRR